MALGGTDGVVEGLGAGKMQLVAPFVIKDDAGKALLGVGAGSVATGITAAAGGTQAGALALDKTKSVHVVSTAASANDSVKLPLATGSGAHVFVKNSAAANSIQLFGSGTDTIDGVATATGVAIAAGKARLCVDSGAGTWVSLLGA